MAQVVELKDGMNHHPAYPGIWVPYTGWRMKDRYDIKLKTGEVWQYYYPNGGSFSKFGKHDGPSRVEDDEIAEIRFIPDEELTEEYWFRGKDRMDRNRRYFGDVFPTVTVAEDGTVVFTPIKRRIFDEWVVSTWDGKEAMWLRVDELSVEEFKTQLNGQQDSIDPNSVLGSTLKTYINLICGEIGYDNQYVQIPMVSGPVPFDLAEPTNHPPEACMSAVVTLEKMWAEYKAKVQAEAAEKARIDRLGFTPTGKAARRRIAVDALAAHLMTSVGHKVPGGGKHEKDDRFVTKAETRVVDGKKLTGKQLRKLRKKQNKQTRYVEVADGTE